MAGKHLVNIDVNYVGTHHKVTFADIDFQIVDDDLNQLYYRQTKGVAQRNYEDKGNELIGIKLAIGRALEDLGKGLQKSAWGEVIHQDNIKKTKTKTKATKDLKKKATRVNQTRKQ